MKIVSSFRFLRGKILSFNITIKINKNKIFILFSGCALISVRLWNSKDGGSKNASSRIDMLKGNRCILRIRGAPDRQKLGMILENEVLQKLKLEFFFTKKWSPKLIFLNCFFFF